MQQWNKKKLPELPGTVRTRSTDESLRCPSHHRPSIPSLAGPIGSKYCLSFYERERLEVTLPQQPWQKLAGAGRVLQTPSSSSRQFAFLKTMICQRLSQHFIGISQSILIIYYMPPPRL